jgi:hypothetical protein
MKDFLRFILFSSLLVAVTGCEQMKAGEHGVKFSKLPWFLGGGIKERIVTPGAVEIVFPWERLYKLDTTVQSITWGDAGRGSDPAVDDTVETRARDGNEVGLSVTIRYRVQPEMLTHLIQKVGIDMNSVERLVTASARAEIRNKLNVLRTKDFFSPEKRQAALEEVKTSLNNKLHQEGISIDEVSYHDHRFERRMPDGSFDRSYQEQIDKTQAVNQQTEQEENKITLVIERKKQEFNEALGRVNRLVEEADGYKRQATLKGDAYLTTKRNEAEQVRSAGMSEVEGLKKQIEALQGPGGRAILRLAIVKALISAHPKFILINSPNKNSSSGSSAIDVNRTDTNDLIKEIGLFESLKEKEETKPNK